MREDDDGQVRRLDALREREVGRNFEPVASGVADRLHVRHVLDGQLGPRGVELLHGLRLAVEEVDRAGVHVARDRDRHQAVVVREAAESELAVGEVRAEEGEVGGEGVGLGVEPRAVAGVIGQDQLVRLVREEHAAEVHLPLGVALDEGLLARRRVEEDEFGEVALALVRDHVDAATIFVVADGPTGFLDGAGVDRLRLELQVLADAEDFRRAVVRGAEGETDVPVVVHLPARDPLRVLDHELALAGFEVESVDVVPRRIAVVEAHDDLVRAVVGRGIDLGAHVVERREVAGGRDAGGGVGLGAGVDGVDVVVLVAALVLDVEDVAAVLAPEVARDGALVGRERPGCIERLVDAFDPDVHHVVIGLAEGEVLAVGRELRAGDFGVAEEHLPVDERRELGRGGLDGGGEREQEHAAVEQGHGRRGW